MLNQGGYLGHNLLVCVVLQRYGLARADTRANPAALTGCGLDLGNTLIVYSGHTKRAGPHAGETSHTLIRIHYRDYPPNQEIRLRENGYRP